MVKGQKKIIKSALKMLDWAYKNKLYASIEVHAAGLGVRFRCQPDSYRNVHLFKRAFKKVGTLTKETDNDSMSYSGELDGVSIRFYAIEDLPPNCEKVYTKVEVPEEFIEAHTIPAHTETVSEIICTNGKKEAIPA